jgi:hypothetical protein
MVNALLVEGLIQRMGWNSNRSIRMSGSSSLSIYLEVNRQHSIKRLNQQKKNKERERKELDALNRRNLTNVRVVQRNVVYVTGIGPRFAREEVGISVSLY